MKILYGVCGVGNGHATRTKVVVQHLLRRGHTVLLAASDEAYRFLSHAFPYGDERALNVRVVPIVGLGMRCADGALDLRASIEENLRRLPSMMTGNAVTWAEAERFSPDVVVTDFDSFAALFASGRGLPLVSIDNGQVVVRCVHDPGVLAAYRDGLQALASFTELKTMRCDHYVVTSFFFPPVRPELVTTTTLVQPILREEVLHQLPSRLASPPAPLVADRSAHVLVYKTSSLDPHAFVAALSALPHERFVVYGCAPDVALPANAVRRGFDEATFIHDLAGCRAVVGNGGMSLLGEALSFGKPVFAVPMRGQFEQHLNACYVQHLGYGVAADQMDPNLLDGFLRNLPRYAEAVRQRPPHDGNAGLYRTLDALLPS